jgi:hypothetical protein
MIFFQIFFPSKYSYELLKYRKYLHSFIKILQKLISFLLNFAISVQPTMKSKIKKKRNYLSFFKLISHFTVRFINKNK